MNDRPTDRPVHFGVHRINREKTDDRAENAIQLANICLEWFICLFECIRCARPLLIPISFSIFQANVICHTYPSSGGEIEEGKQLIYYWIYYICEHDTNGYKIRESCRLFSAIGFAFLSELAAVEKRTDYNNAQTIEPSQNGQRRRSIRCEKGNRIFMDRI